MNGDFDAELTVKTGLRLRNLVLFVDWKCGDDEEEDGSRLTSAILNFAKILTL